MQKEFLKVNVKIPGDILLLKLEYNLFEIKHANVKLSI